MTIARTDIWYAIHVHGDTLSTRETTPVALFQDADDARAWAKERYGAKRERGHCYIQETTWTYGQAIPIKQQTLRRYPVRCLNTGRRIADVEPGIRIFLWCKACHMEHSVLLSDLENVPEEGELREQAFP